MLYSAYRAARNYMPSARTAIAAGGLGLNALRTFAPYGRRKTGTRNRAQVVNKSFYLYKKPEMKYCDVNTASYAFHVAAGNVACLNVTAAGASETNRIGTKINMKSLQIKGIIKPSGSNAAAVGQEAVRFLIVYDRQFNETLPATADILQNFDTTQTAQTNIYSGINMDNRERFVILRDIVRVVPPIGINGAAPAVNNLTTADMQALKIDMWINLKNLETHYNRTANNTYADITTGALLLLTVSEEVSATTAWVLSASFRLRYTD